MEIPQNYLAKMLRVVVAMSDSVVTITPSGPTGPGSYGKQIRGAAKMTKSQAIEKLLAQGATHEKKEDQFGDTKAGWWMDTVYLAPYKMPELALQVLNGGA